MCRSPNNSRPRLFGTGGYHRSQSEHFVTFPEANSTTQEDNSDTESPLLLINQVKQSTPKPIVVPVTVNGKAIQMELDTGAGVTIISKVAWEVMFPTSR